MEAIYEYRDGEVVEHTRLETGFAAHSIRILVLELNQRATVKNRSKRLLLAWDEGEPGCLCVFDPGGDRELDSDLRVEVHDRMIDYRNRQDR